MQSLFIINNNKVSGTYNIGSGTPTTISLAKMIIKIVGRGKIAKIKLNDDAEFSMLMLRKLKISALRDLLNW